MSDLIDRQAAIEALDEQIEQCNKSLSSFDISLKDEYAVKVERASLVAFRETLEYLPPAQLGANLAEVGTDTISRAKAIEAVMECYDNDELFEVYEDKLRELPPAQPERIKGHWIEKPHVHGVAYCSLCDYELHTNDTNFCPNCGAEMEVTA